MQLIIAALLASSALAQVVIHQPQCLSDSSWRDTTKQCQITIDQMYVQEGGTNGPVQGCTEEVATGNCGISICSTTNSRQIVPYSFLATVAQDIHASCKANRNTAGYSKTSYGTADFIVKLAHSNTGVPAKRRRGMASESDIHPDLLTLAAREPGYENAAPAPTVTDRDAPTAVLEARAGQSTVVTVNGRPYTLVNKVNLGDRAGTNEAHEQQIGNQLITDWRTLPTGRGVTRTNQLFYDEETTWGLAYVARNNHDINDVEPDDLQGLLQGFYDFRSNLGMLSLFGVEVATNGVVLGQLMMDVVPDDFGGDIL
jgi:hypothetical protein